MGSRSAPAPVTTVQQAGPPAFLQPGLEQAAQAAQAQFEGPAPQFFPGSTVVPFAPQTEQALQLTEQRALAGSPLVSGAQQTLGEIIGGRGVNPFLGQAVSAATAPLFEQFSGVTLPGLRSAFAGIGRGGSGSEQQALLRATTALGRGVSEQAGRLAFGSAEAEAQRQLQATQLAPGLAAQDFADIQRLAGVGQIREGQAGLQLQEQIDRFNFSQQIEQQRVNQLINQLTSLGGGLGTVTTTAPGIAQPSRLSSGLSGGLSGAASGAAIGSIVPGLGTGIGAGVGGLLGLIGGFA